MKRIVVGVDGSPESVGALRFALEEARRRGAHVRAVCAWHVPAAVHGAGFARGRPHVADFEQAAEVQLADTLAAADAEASGVEVEPLVREGRAAEVLLAEADEADLLVVGSRGLGGFRELLLGSVSHQCCQHARCPVAVVPAAQRSRRR